MPQSNPSHSARAEELFDEFLRQRDEGKSADFDALCAAYPELSSELRSLHKANEAVCRLLPGPLAEHPELDGEAPSDLLEKLRVRGPRGGRYRRIGEIGRGGMGVVLRVEDDELRRELAMKVAGRQRRTPGGARSDVDPKTLGRFFEEAQITGQLDHPGIVPVHEIGIDSDGSVYYTMRLVRGDNLRQVFDRVRSGAEGWSQVRALSVVAKVCEAMSYAHSKGVIHRDLKPANVMVGSFGEVYVMDWGLARVMGRDDNHDLRIKPDAPAPVSAVDTERSKQRESTPNSPLVTMDGDVLGTPAYMSPEQATGELGRLGPHSDVYSVGAMLYHLLSGQIPFATSDESPSSRTILDRLKKGPPTPLHQIARAAPVELAAICDKAMARDVSARYPDMRALADDLRAYVEGRVVRAYEAGTWAETRKWVRRNKFLAAALAAAIVLLSAGAVLMASYVGAVDERGEVNAVRAAMQRLEEVQRRTNDRNFTPGRTKSATNWWIENARALVRGSQADPDHGIPELKGLPAFRAMLENLRSEGGMPTADEVATARASFSMDSELEVLKAELLWRDRMFSRKSWPEPGQVQAEMDALDLPAPTEKLTKEDILSIAAWIRVRPDHPRLFGSERLALALSERAVGFTPKGPKLAGRLDTLAFAYLHCGMFPEAKQSIERAWTEASPGDRASYLDNNRRIVLGEIEGWQDGTEQRIYDRLSWQVRALERKRGGDDSRHFDDPGTQWWYDRLRELVDALTYTESLLEAAERAATTPQARQRWEMAIAAIKASDTYGHLTITPQLHLIPIGQDPESKLWEFAHLPSGEPATIGADGHTEMRFRTGMVFVLIPGGTMPGRETQVVPPFFISKHEMTETQWARMDQRPTTYKWLKGTVTSLPASNLSVDDCQELLRTAGGWLRLPTRVEWEYACRGGKTTPWWTGATPKTLENAELVLFDPQTLKNAGASPIAVSGGDVKRRANPFGLYDMHGNVSEWSGDPYVETTFDGLWKRGQVRGFRPLGGNYGRDPEYARLDYGGEPGFYTRVEHPIDVGLRPVRCLTR